MLRRGSWTAQAGSPPIFRDPRGTGHFLRRRLLAGSSAAVTTGKVFILSIFGMFPEGFAMRVLTLSLVHPVILTLDTTPSGSA